MNASARNRPAPEVLAAALSAALAAAALAPAAEASWSARKLPGCDDLSVRMAGYYEPVAADVKAGVPQYKLPLDLGKLSNAGFAAGLHALRAKGLAEPFNALLRKNGFAALPAGRYDDVPGFYKAVKEVGLPIFVTSDSLLHLYHIQFDETLKDIEERKFFDDAALISKAVQAEALKLHARLDGDLQAAARLLVAYSTVPVVLLAQSDLGAEAAAALKEVSSWTGRRDWRRQQAFKDKYGEVLQAVAAAKKVGPDQLLWQPKLLADALAGYCKAHPADTGAGKSIPKLVEADVQAELKLIAEHKGFAKSPLFGYKEDYSQYVPRGHYTRSEILKQYFKALMWYGRMTFLIRGATGEVSGIIPLEQARIQTLAACILAGTMDGKLADGRTVAKAWDRLYSVTAYYVGLADDLTPYEYRSALRGAVGEDVTAAALTDAGKFFDLRRRLAQMRKPEIYSGLGNLAGPPAGVADEKTLAEMLGLTQGMRLMGQRYIPDSYMMGKCVYPAIGRFAGKGAPFTLVHSQGGPIRGFPRGLDVMAVLASDRARHWLKDLGDDAYERYDEALGKLTAKFGALDEASWNRNMYWSWLYALKALLKPCPSTYPTFMQTDAWRDKQLSAALASWAQLRHDTILYAKQSYTPRATSIGPPPKMVEGYVEPVCEFYARLLALTQMTIRGLTDFDVLTPAGLARLNALEQVVERLLKISRQELANEKLTADDYAFIRSFGDSLAGVVAGVNREGTETTIVADVHTDANSGQVLEEATGYLHQAVVVYPMPDGGLVAGVGPILTHYEFKHPMADRLTDEAWKKMLQAGQNPPLPEWARSFTAQPAK